MSAQRKVLSEGQLLKRCKFAWSPRHVCLLSSITNDYQFIFELLIYDQRKRKLKMQLLMDQIESINISKTRENAFQLILTKRGNPLIHFRAPSRDEFVNWVALLKVGMAKGNLFHVKTVSSVSLISDHALIRFIGFGGDKSARFIQLLNPVTEHIIYIWGVDKISQLVWTDVGLRMDLCKRCYRSHHLPNQHTFMVPAYFKEPCIAFLCRETGAVCSCDNFTHQNTKAVGSVGVSYKIPSHDCGARVLPPTSPAPSPPVEPPPVREAPPLPPRHIPRIKYLNGPKAMWTHAPAKPYCVTKPKIIDDAGRVHFNSEVLDPVCRPTPGRSSFIPIPPRPEIVQCDNAEDFSCTEDFWMHLPENPSSLPDRHQNHVGDQSYRRLESNGFECTEGSQKDRSSQQLSSSFKLQSLVDSQGMQYPLHPPTEIQPSSTMPHLSFMTTFNRLSSQDTPNGAGHLTPRVSGFGNVDKPLPPLPADVEQSSNMVYYNWSKMRETLNQLGYTGDSALPPPVPPRPSVHKWSQHGFDKSSDHSSKLEHSLSVQPHPVKPSPVRPPPVKPPKPRPRRTKTTKAPSRYYQDHEVPVGIVSSHRVTVQENGSNSAHNSPITLRRDNELDAIRRARLGTVTSNPTKSPSTQTGYNSSKNPSQSACSSSQGPDHLSTVWPKGSAFIPESWSTLSPTPLSSDPEDMPPAPPETLNDKDSTEMSVYLGENPQYIRASLVLEHDPLASSVDPLTGTPFESRQSSDLAKSIEELRTVFEKAPLSN